MQYTALHNMDATVSNNLCQGQESLLPAAAAAADRAYLCACPEVPDLVGAASRDEHSFVQTLLETPRLNTCATK